MKTICAIVLLLVVVAAATDKFWPSDEEARLAFGQFIREHNKAYVSLTEREARFQIFKENMAKSRLFNSFHTSAQYGITKFADMSEDEFKEMYLRPIPTDSLRAANKMMPPMKHVKAIPDTWDWRDQGAVTPVKNQGGCGSCWSFSTTGNIEGQWYLKNHKLVSLAEQELVDCDKECTTWEQQQACDSGCEGGLPWNAYEYVIKSNGLSTEDSYPYEGIDDTCRNSSKTVGATIADWSQIPEDEGQIASFLVSFGPLSVALNAQWLQFYMGGISDPLFCDSKSLDHAVLIVGYGSGETVFGKRDYWLVKNSWGESWGEKGYFKIVRGKGKCGINTAVTTSHA